MQACDYQPRLSAWSHVWRYALAVGIAALGWFELATWQWDHNRLWFWSDLGLGVLGLVLTAWRRRYPVAIALVTSLFTCVSASAGGPATLALLSLSTRRQWREIVPLGLVTLACSTCLEVINPVGGDSYAISGSAIVSITAVTVGWGLYIGSRRELMATLRDRADTAESQQAARVAQARAAERSRIAREMHDVLAHRISLVTMHAGALAYRQDLTAEQMRSVATIIQDSSHQALVELREVLGVLRDDPGDAAPDRPQPSAEDLPELISEARRSGMHVETERGVRLDGVPETLGRTVYRVVQEGLTNARKHAPDTLVVVNLDGSPEDGLSVEVRNLLRIGSPAGVAPVSGLGLIGLSERTALAGGRMTHSIDGREFVLKAWLPWLT